MSWTKEFIYSLRLCPIFCLYNCLYDCQYIICVCMFVFLSVRPFPYFSITSLIWIVCPCWLAKMLLMFTLTWLQAAVRVWYPDSHHYEVRKSKDEIYYNIQWPSPFFIFLKLIKLDISVSILSMFKIIKLLYTNV